MMLATQNIKGFPDIPDAQVRKAVRVLSGFDNLVVGRQEIKEDQDKRAVAEASPEYMNHLFGPPRCAQPISYDSRLWTVEDKGNIMLHPETPDVIGNPRFLLWAVFQNKETGYKFVFTNKHYVPDGWSGVLGPRETDMRRRMWISANIKERHFNEMVIKEWGLALAGVGDYNRRLFPVVGTEIHGYKIRYLSPDTTIDKVWVCNGNKFSWTVTVEDMSIPNPIEESHSIRWAKANLRRTSKR